MRKILVYSLFLLFILSCNKKANSEFEVESAIESPTSSDENSNLENNVASKNNLKKFVYVLIKIKTPKLDSYEFEGVYTIDENINRHEEIPARTIYSAKWEESVYSTDIMEIENYNEDEKYRMLDNAENNISLQHNLSSSDMNFRLEIDARCKDNTERERLKENKSQITNSEVYVFDSYAEASQHKRENTTAN